MNRSFWEELFDMNFSKFITVRLVKILYLLSIVILGLIALAMLISGFGMMGYSTGMGLLTIVLTPIVFLLGLIYTRIFLELVMVLFRIEANTALLNRPKQ